MGFESPITAGAQATAIDHAAIHGSLGDPRFLTYLHGRFAGARQERLHVVYCDDAERYLHDETLLIGAEHSLVVKARPLVHRALTVGAQSLVLAHNHLSGICRPSEQDVAATRRLQQLGRELELTLIDHLIFTHDRAFSMRMGGYL